MSNKRPTGESAPRSHRPESSRRLLKMLPLLGALLGSSSPRAETAEDDKAPSVSKETDAMPPVAEFLRESFRFVIDHPIGVKVNFYEPDGTPRFNDPKVWLEPFTLQVGFPVAKRLFDVSIPYTFSEDFVSTEPTSDRDIAEFQREVLSTLRNAWLSEVATVPKGFFSEEDIRFFDEDGNERNNWSRVTEVGTPDRIINEPLAIARVASIRITGSASPEHGLGDESTGDFLNGQLAKRRGEDAQDILLHYLPYVGMEKLPVGFVVPEYTPDDVSELLRVAHEVGVSLDLSTRDQLLAVIGLHNRDQIAQEPLKTTMERIVGAKRSVHLEITFENGQRGIWQIPFPALILLGLYASYRVVGYARRRREEAQHEA